MESTNAETTTLYDTIRYGSRLSQNGPCLGWRPDVDDRSTGVIS